MKQVRRVIIPLLFIIAGSKLLPNLLLGSIYRPNTNKELIMILTEMPLLTGNWPSTIDQSMMLQKSAQTISNLNLLLRTLFSCFVSSMVDIQSYNYWQMY
eukprot:NODE_381_length_9671_cov_0.208838.p6 type:complete len:100 gc:universal NODE_381_length_9671_cov_0.208838:7935-8234(+)